jgi:two-component system, LytTR family, response regulator
MKALIIDDEKSARDSLKILLNNYCPFVKILDEADSGKSGIEAIRRHKPDLVFLDVEIGDMTGFEMLDWIGSHNINFDIIFSTAHNHYAVTAFRYAAIDFLPKPVRDRSLLQAVMRVQENLRDKERLEYYAILKENLKPQADKRMVLKTIEGVNIVSESDIIYFQTVPAKTMTSIYLTNNRQYSIAKNIGEYEQLEPFIRVHNATIINPNHIQRIVKSPNNWLLELSENHHVEVTKSRKEDLAKWMGKLE